MSAISTMLRGALAAALVATSVPVPTVAGAAIATVSGLVAVAAVSSTAEARPRIQPKRPPNTDEPTTTNCKPTKIRHC